MLTRVVFVVLCALSFNAAAICSVTTRGPECNHPPVCGPGMVLNTDVGQCVPNSPAVCPVGTVATPRSGGGISCITPMTCLDGNAHIVACETGSVVQSATQPQPPCEMKMRWARDHPEQATLTELSSGCDSDADLATARILTRLLGGS